MLEQLHQISVALNSTTDTNEILKLTCKAAVEICGVDHSAVVLFDKNQLKGKVIAEYPPQDNFVETEIRVKGIPLEERLVYQQQIINIHDLHDCEPLDDVQKKLIGFNIRSVLIVPVVLNGKVIASFSLDMFKRPRIFHPEEIKLLKEFGSQVATAIGKARFVKELSVINRLGHDIGSAAPMDLDVEQLLALVRTHTGSLMDVTNFYIALYDEESSRYCFPYHMDEKDDITCIPVAKFNKSLTDYVRRSKTAVRVDSRKNRELLEKGEIELVGTPARVWLGVPLVARGKVLGVMAIQDYQSENTFDEHDLTVLQTIASQTAIALDNARLFERLQQQRDSQINAMCRISSSIAASVDQDEMFRHILKGVISLIGKAHLAEIRLLNPATGQLEVMAFQGVPIKEIHRKIPVGQGVIGWVARHRSPVLVKDAAGDHRYIPIYDGAGSEIAVPLLKDDELIGVLNIEHIGKSAFDDVDLALAEVIAGFAVVAIKNARLHKERDTKIKDLQDANQRIAAAQELVTRTKIAAGFIHRLNNLAGTIPIRTNIAKEKLDPGNSRDAEVVKQLDVIAQHSEALLLAAREIKDTERSQAPEDLVINEILDLAVKRAVSSAPDIERQICIEKSFDENLQPVCVERHKLLDALGDIVLNAVESMPGSGNLALFTGKGRLGDSPCIIIAISDTGVGIPTANLSRVFDLFFTTKEKGLGFGLWRGESVIRELGGDIDVTSKEGKGSTFTIKIPVSRTARSW